MTAVNVPEFYVVIPARYASTRLPGKPLLDIAGKPMVAWVVEQAKKSGAKQVIVATDDARIFNALAQFDFQVTGYQDDNALLGVDSTILDLSVSPARILRKGKITKDDLLAALPELTME